MGRRKTALIRLEGLAPNIENHLEKIKAMPHDPAVAHWKREVRGWLGQGEALLPDLGKKTAQQWQAKIADWQNQLEN